MRIPTSLCLLSLLVTSAFAADQPLPLAVVPPVTIGDDGQVVWTRAAVLGPFVKVDGSGQPTAATTARICRTADQLLIHVDCAEPRLQELTATVTQRDANVWGDDCVELFLQLPGRPDYAHFVVNPLGARYDELDRDSSWNTDWAAAAGREAASWWCEFRIPLSVAGQPKDGQEWHLNLCRSRRPEPELSAWSPTYGGFHVPERFGLVRFSTQPWPAALSWSTGARGQVAASATWLPRPDGVGLSLNGQPGGSFRLAAEGIQPLWLEAKLGDQPIYRACHIAVITPVNEALQAARGAAEGLPEGDDRQALLRQLDQLRALRDEAGPALAEQLAARARETERRANRLQLRLAARQQGVKDDGVTYGVETSLVKLLKHLPFKGQAGGAVKLDAARHEMDAAQVVVFAFDDPLLMLTASLTDAKSRAGQVLPASAFRVRREGYIHTCQPVYRVDYTGLYPDPLVVATPFDVKADDFEPLWVDVRVPDDTLAGVYHGKLILDARNARPTEVPIEVRVRNFTIPAHASVCSAFGMNPNWRVSQDRQAYLDNFLEHRITPYSVAPSPTLVKPPAMDWSQATALRFTVTAPSDGELRLLLTPAEGGLPALLGPEHVTGGAPREVSFKLPQGLTQVQAWQATLSGPARATVSATLVSAKGNVELLPATDAALTAGEDGWLTGWLRWTGSAWDRPEVPAEWDWTEFDAAFAKALEQGITTHRAPLRAPLGPWAAALQEHCGEKGWLKYFYTYLYDEPEPSHFDLVNERLGEVKRAAPGLANMMTARRFPPELPYVDTWCPEAYSFDPEAAKVEQAKGKSVWWYVAFSTRHPYPNVWVDYPNLDCRVWPWMTWKHDLDGMLYWSVTAWGRNDPWRTAETFHDSNGDGSILYPGVDGRPVDSIRWECLRDGMEDYEVFCLLQAGAAELAEQQQSPELVAQAKQLYAIDDGVVKSYKSYNPDPAGLLGARAQMSETLEAIVKALGHEPQIVGRPRYRTPVPVPEVVPETTHRTTPDVADWQLPAAAPEEGLVARFDFDQKLPFACDRSGRFNHGLVSAAEYVPGLHGQALRLHPKGSVVLPSGLALFGDQPAAGSVSLWVKPEFEPEALPSGLYEGYAVLFYAMQTDGNGLPDGYDEIGIFLHGSRLCARVGGKNCSFASVDHPLRRGQWTHLALTWGPNLRVLYVDGKSVARREGAFDPPALDAFRSVLGAHSPHLGWTFAGALDEVRLYTRMLTAEEIGQLAAR